MLLRLLPSILRVSARRLHAEFACAGFPAPYNRKRRLVAQAQGLMKCGDDACFVGHARSSNVALGIADGVGGWREHGFDAGYVSLGLMRAAEELSHSKNWDVTDPVRWLADSHDLMLSRCDNKTLGSSTICLCGVDLASGEMFAANLGDSGLLVLSSRGEPRFKSESHQVEFNAPLQLAAPTELASHYANHTHASFYTSKLEDGDFVVLASDGVWDNIHPEDIGSFILKEYKMTTDVQDIVHKLVLKTKDLSKSVKIESPFATKAKAAGYEYEGGKPDDITIILMAVNR